MKTQYVVIQVEHYSYSPKQEIEGLKIAYEDLPKTFRKPNNSFRKPVLNNIPQKAYEIAYEELPKIKQ